ncbi:MAG: 5-formyltetrahydrofolate cyclo-ligase [Burkholderiaceae bacterium]
MDTNVDRKLQRQRLLDVRNALTNRQTLEATLQSRVRDWLRQASLHTLGFYFPIRGEPDLRAIIAEWLAADDRRVAALPVISGEVLEFHAWTKDAPLRAGGYGIPVPAQGRIAQPQCLLIPCLGFDQQRFRLGYGGGYYDRTLASLDPRPQAVGVAFEAARIESIDAQPHDVKMDLVVTETGLT